MSSYLRYQNLARIGPPVQQEPLPNIPNLPPTDDTNEFINSITLQNSGLNDIDALHLLPFSFAGYPLTYALVGRSSPVVDTRIQIFNTEGYRLFEQGTGLSTNINSITSDLLNTIYISTGGGIYKSVYNPTTNSFTTEALLITINYRGVSFENGVLYGLRTDQETIDTINVNDGTIITTLQISDLDGRIIATGPSHLYLAVDGNKIEVRNLEMPYSKTDEINIQQSISELSHYNQFLFTSTTGISIDVLRLGGSD